MEPHSRSITSPRLQTGSLTRSPAVATCHRQRERPAVAAPAVGGTPDRGVGPPHQVWRPHPRLPDRPPIGAPSPPSSRASARAAPCPPSKKAIDRARLPRVGRRLVIAARLDALARHRVGVAAHDGRADALLPVALERHRRPVVEVGARGLHLRLCGEHLDERLESRPERARALETACTGTATGRPASPKMALRSALAIHC